MRPAAGRSPLSQALRDRLAGLWLRFPCCANQEARPYRWVALSKIFRHHNSPAFPPKLTLSPSDISLHNKHIPIRKPAYIIDYTPCRQKRKWIASLSLRSMRGKMTAGRLPSNSTANTSLCLCFLVVCLKTLKVTSSVFSLKPLPTTSAMNMTIWLLKFSTSSSMLEGLSSAGWRHRQLPTLLVKTCIHCSIPQRSTSVFRASTISQPSSRSNPNDSYATEAQFDQEVDSELQIDSELPQYSSQQIQVLETFVGSGAVSRVLVQGQGQEMLCKARKSGLLDQNLERELFSLQTIKAFSRESKLIRTPQLIAYVKHAGNGHIIGLLREWIPSGVLGGSLKAVCTSTTGKERKEK